MVSATHTLTHSRLASAAKLEAAGSNRSYRKSDDALTWDWIGNNDHGLVESVFMASTLSEVEIKLYADPIIGTSHRRCADSHSRPTPREAARFLPASLPVTSGSSSDLNVQTPSMGADEATKADDHNTSNRYAARGRLSSSTTKAASLVRHQLPLVHRHHWQNRMPYFSGESVDDGVSVVDSGRSMNTYYGGAEGGMLVGIGSRFDDILGAEMVDSYPMRLKF